MMKKVLRIFLKALAVLFGLIALVFVVAIINQQARLPGEAKQYPAPGKLVTVNGHKLHVYAQGQGNFTYVFLSGAGTSCPVLDFKPLWSRLSKTERIAVIEKSGYGWSESAGAPRDIGTILSESRQALALSGVKPPYVLVAHSMSGLEALYWAKQYPGEVGAIIGLDPCIPQAYDQMSMPPLPVAEVLHLTAQSGITRFFPQLAESSAVLQPGLLSEHDRQEYRAMFYRSTMTKDMINELSAVKSNAQTVKKAGVPDVPMYFFISDGKEIGLRDWRALLSGYVGGLKTGRYLYLDCGHYVHDYKPDLIAQESEKFTNKVMGAA